MAVFCVGLLSDRQQADAAVEELRRQGISPEDVSVILSRRGVSGRLFDWEKQHHVGSAGLDHVEAGDGRRLGLAWLAFEAGSLTLPLAGYLIAVGGLVVGMAGVASRLAMIDDRSLAGALQELGMSAEEARYHEKRVAKGACLIVVDCSQCAAETVREVLLRHGAEDRMHQARQPGPTAGQVPAGSEV